jgi:hypothetical protein
MDVLEGSVKAAYSAIGFRDKNALIQAAKRSNLSVEFRP